MSRMTKAEKLQTTLEINRNDELDLIARMNEVEERLKNSSEFSLEPGGFSVSWWDKFLVLSQEYASLRVQLSEVRRRMLHLFSKLREEEDV